MLKCPKCSAELQLVLQLVEPPQAPKVVTMGVKGVQVQVSDIDIRDAAKTLEPKPIDKYSVSLEAHSGQVEDFPIRQIVREVLTKKKPGIGCPNAHACARYLTELGFEVRNWQG